MNFVDSNSIIVHYSSYDRTFCALIHLIFFNECDKGYQLLPFLYFDAIFIILTHAHMHGMLQFKFITFMP